MRSPLSLLGSATATRTRALDAESGAVWAILADPHHQPRWWPGVERVEGVSPTRFTQVLRSGRGRPVRVDFTVAEARAPHRLRWRQELAGSPFARILTRSAILIELEDEAAGCRVTLTHEQRLRGSSRTGGFMLRRSTGRRLDQALAGLAEVTAPVDHP